MPTPERVLYMASAQNTDGWLIKELDKFRETYTDDSRGAFLCRLWKHFKKTEEYKSLKGENNGKDREEK